MTDIAVVMVEGNNLIKSRIHLAAADDVVTLPSRSRLLLGQLLDVWDPYFYRNDVFGMLKHGLSHDKKLLSPATILPYVGNMQCYN